MKKIALVSFLLLVFVGTAQAQCNCDKAPFLPDPPCWDVCTTRLLDNLSLRQLIDAIGIRENVARKIVEWPRRGSVRKFDEYREILSREEFVHVKSRLKSLNDWQLRQLRAGPRDLSSELEGAMKEEVSPSDSATKSDTRLEEQLSRLGLTKTTVETPAMTYYYYKDKKGYWRWKLKAADGRTIAYSGQAYNKEQDCLADINRVKASSTASLVIE